MHDFGNVQVGTTVTFSFQLTNVGTRISIISDVTMRGTCFFPGYVYVPDQAQARQKHRIASDFLTLRGGPT